MCFTQNIYVTPSMNKTMFCIYTNYKIIDYQISNVECESLPIMIATIMVDGSASSQDMALFQKVSQC